MSSVIIQGDSSGSVTLQAPAAAGNTTITLPTISGGSFIVSDSSGNVGIGTSSPSYKLQVKGAVDNASTSIGISDSNGRTLLLESPFASGVSYIGNYATSVPFGFKINGSEVARFDSSGNLLVGTASITTPTTGFTAGFSGSYAYTQTAHPTGTGSGATYSNFLYNGSSIGSITQNGTTGVLYNLTSDYRLKNDPQPLTGAKEFVMALQPKKWQWWDGSGEGVGFIAHEFMEVAKYSGNGEKDAVDENGDPVYQSIQPSSSEVMANLVSFIQELNAKVEAQAAEIATLKGQA